MNTHRPRLSLVLVSLFVGAAAAFTGCGGSSAQPASGAVPEPSEPPPAEAASAAPSSDPVSEPASSARPTKEEAGDKPLVLKLDGQGLPLSIEMPKADLAAEARGWTLDKTGGAEVGSGFTKAYVHVYKADAKLKTLAAAKVTRKKMSGCDAYPLVKEEADHLVFDCKMRSMHTHQFLMLKEIGGTTYVCESQSHAETVADLEASLAACRTLKAL
jgi:hypothetical protein